MTQTINHTVGMEGDGQDIRYAGGLRDSDTGESEQWTNNPERHSSHTHFDGDLNHFNNQNNFSSAFEQELTHILTAAEHNPVTGQVEGGEVGFQEEEGTEEVQVPQQVNNQDDEPEGIASSRRARTRRWPDKSDPHNIYPSITQRRAQFGNQVIRLGQGRKSGRNCFVIFQDADSIPRLAFNILVKGRTNQQWRAYPSPHTTALRIGASLAEVLAQCPNHVWSDGLRLFMAEGWSAEKIWRGLPQDARHEGSSTRPWNYLQQALGREADKVEQEHSGRKRILIKRARRDELNADNNDDDDIAYTNTSIGALQTT